MSTRIDQKLAENGVSAAEFLRDWGHKCTPAERGYLRSLIDSEKLDVSAAAVAPVTAVAVAEPESDTSADAQFEDCRNYLTAIFRPGDTLCFVGIVHNRDKGKESIENDFVPYEQAISRQYFEELRRSNNAASIYVAMNTFPPALVGQKVGRTQENVVEVRAVQADIDYNGQTTIEAIKASAAVPQPSIVVESSTGKFQGIWLVDGISKEDAKPLMQAIAATFNTDSAVAEVARVMRVPGFVNKKYDSAPIARTLLQTNARYTRADFRVTIPETTQQSDKGENWVNDVVVTHGNAYNDLLSLAGYYVRSKNINDSEMLFKLLAGHCEHAVDRDGRTPWQPNLSQVREYANKWAKEFETGESIQARTKLTLNQPSQAPHTVAAPAGPQPWGEIIPLEDVLLPVPKFEEKFLPAAIRPYCMDVSERMSVPLDFSGIAAIETLFGVTGRRVFVYPKALDKTWHESLALSGGIVAGSGRTKTPVWKLFTNITVEQELDWARQHSREFAAYQEVHKKWEDAVKAAKGKKDAEPVGEEPQEPLKPQRLVMNDSTPEKVHSLMSENPTGLFYYRDELSGWVDELDKEGREGQRTLFLSAMTGNDPYSMDRIGRGTVFAIMCLSVAGNFQPDLLRKFLSDGRNVADGMVARFSLLVWPDTVKPKALDRPPNEAAKNSFRHVLRTIAMIKPEAVRMHFDTDGQALYFQWLNDLIDRSEAESHEGKKAHYDKYKGALPKVAALFQLVDLVALGGTFKGDFQIDKAHTQMAIDFFQYLEAHMHRIYESAYTPTQIAEVALVGRIQNGEMPNMLTARDIHRKHWKGMTKLSPTEVEFALENLAEKNWVRPVEIKPDGAGRPAIRWEVNPIGRKL